MAHDISSAETLLDRIRKRAALPKSTASGSPRNLGLLMLGVADAAEQLPTLARRLESMAGESKCESHGASLRSIARGLQEVAENLTMPQCSMADVEPVKAASGSCNHRARVARANGEAVKQTRSDREIASTHVPESIDDVAAMSDRAGHVTQVWIEEPVFGQVDSAIAVDLSNIADVIGERYEMSVGDVQADFWDWLGMQGADVVADLVASWLADRITVGGR